MKTHDKGMIGELAVRKSLLEMGYSVFLPEVDNEQIDLIIEQDNGQFRRIQVKTVLTQKTSTSIEVNMLKYKNTGRVDVVAIYYAPKDIIAYVPYENQHSINLALTTGKNNQKKGRKWFYQYERFPEFS
ncbi:MAG: hypothetical protein CMB80_12330 [Flammeovirgaceae bacterium]|nr:hypothetical protein [Flammeovirgaceae bacterium]|tara:strand:+ start:192 stop:578 length:387 start_codon:yes stop_codon:yes gene_type:complete